MKFLKILFFYAIFFAISFARPTWVSFGNSDEVNQLVEVLSSNQDETVLKYQLNGFYVDYVEIDSKIYSMFSVPNLTTLHKKGLPDFPKFAISIIIPDDAKMMYTIKSEDWAEYKYYAPVPSKGAISRNVDPTTVPYVFSEIYDKNEPFPGENIELGAPYILRDYRGLTVHFVPFQYIPDKGIIRVCREIVVKVSEVGAGEINTKSRERNSAKTPKSLQNLYKAHFINYEYVTRGKYEQLSEPGKLIIITYDDFVNDVQELVDWKIQKGLETDLVPLSTIGSSSSDIKDYLQDQYDSEESFTYVILVGDAQQIPPLYGTVDSAASDGSYCLLEGDDFYSDAFISRISAQNSSQVLNQISKIVNYEKSPDTGVNADWYSKGTGIASDELGGTDLKDWERADFLRDMLLSFTYTEVDQIYDPGATSSQVINAVSEGRSILNYIGHGSGTSWGTTGFSVSHVTQLSNGHKIPFIIDVSCSNGSFTGYSDCLAEAWVKAGTSENPKGAIGMFSASTGASWVPPCVMQHEAIELLTTNQKQSLGGLVLHGIYATLDEYPGNDGVAVMEQYNLFGDCSLIIRTTPPDYLYASHQPVIIVGSQTFDVSMSGTPDVLVSLSKDGVLYASGETNVAGYVTLQLKEEINEPGEFILTATAFNKVPLIETIQAITPEGPWLTFQDYTIEDTGSGNGNRKWDFGEMIDLYVLLKNVGVDSALNPVTKISNEDQYVVIVQDSSSYPDIDSAGVEQNEVAFTMTANVNTPNNHYAEFHISTFVNDTLGWDNKFSIPIYSPLIGLLDFTLNVVGGNGDDVFDAGETAQLIVSLENTGGSTAENVVGTISTDDQYLTIQNATYNYGIVFADGGTVINSSYPYLIGALPTTPVEHHVELNLAITGDNGYLTNLSIDFIIGFPEILVWDKDGNHNSGTVLNALVTDSLGKSSNYVIGSLPSDNLSYYKAIFIFLGVSPDNYKLTESDVVPLVEFLSNGGCIYMEGGETWAFDSPTSLHSYFNINGTSDGSGDTQFIIGQSDSYTEGLEFSYRGDNSYMDRLSPINPAVSVFKNQNPSYVNTVANDADVYKTIGASFEFGGLVDGGDTNTKEFLLGKMLEFFDIGLTEPGLCDSWIKGDPDNNLIINVLDIVKVIGFILETSYPDTCQKWASDLNEDNKIDVLDLVLMINIILNQSSKGMAKRNYDIATRSTVIHDGRIVRIKSDGSIAAIQLKLKSNDADAVKFYPSDDLNSMEWMVEKVNDGINVVIFSTQRIFLPKDAKLFTIDGNFEVENVVIANALGDRVENGVQVIPLTFTLGQNYPNPFNPNTKISYEIPKESDVRLAIFNIRGELVTWIVDCRSHPGYYEVEWDGKNERGSSVASGIYFYRIQAGSYVKTMKMVLMK